MKDGITSFYWRLVIKPYWAACLGALLLMTGVAALDSLTVALTVPFLDMVTQAAPDMGRPPVSTIREILSSWGIFPEPNNLIFTLLCLVAVLFVSRGVLQLINQYYIASVGYKVRRKVKAMLLEKFLSMPFGSLAKRDRGSVVRDMEATSEAVYTNITRLGNLLSGIVNIAILIFLLVYLSWWATVVALAVAVAGIQGWRWIAERRVFNYSRSIYELRRRQTQLEMDAIDGAKTVKSYGVAAKIIQRYKNLLTEEIGYLFRNTFFANGSASVVEMMGAVVVVSLGAMVFLAPSMGIRFSVFGAILIAMRRLSPLVSAVNNAFVELMQSRRGLEVLDEIMNEIPPEPSGTRAVSKIGEISFEGVGFSYESRPQPVLKEIQLKLRAGTVTAVVGPTGSGKSTLSHLLLGLYQPASGKIKVDGVDLMDIRLEEWRKKIGYVSQDVFLFNASLKDNITLWDDTFTDQQVEQAAKIAQLHEFIQALPKGYETMAGDRGLQLSGGQCQRIAIARALLRRPEILILDEATSALDNLTEKAVYDAIGELNRNAVVLVISHRLKTVRGAQQIAVIKEGRIVECGLHEELARSSGYYSQLNALEGV